MRSTATIVHVKSRTRVQIEPEELPGATVEIQVARANVNQPVRVTMIFDEGLLASDVQKAPWGRWFQTTSVLLGTSLAEPGDTVAVPSPVRSRPTRPRTRKPGRRGHPPEFYEAIARRYNELVLAGSRRPTQDIADEYQVERSTASGWLAGARKRGLLPPGRRGVAG